MPNYKTTKSSGTDFNFSSCDDTNADDLLTSSLEKNSIVNGRFKRLFRSINTELNNLVFS